MAHELVHVEDFFNGNYLQWTFDHMVIEADYIAEYHAYLKSAEIEQGFGIDHGATKVLDYLRPLIPAGFNLDVFNKVKE